MKMKGARMMLVLAIVFISFYDGKGCRVALVCKDERMSRPPFACKQPHCDQFCGRLHPKGWGKCRDHDRFICQCFYVCYHHIPLPKNP